MPVETLMGETLTVPLAERAFEYGKQKLPEVFCWIIGIL